MPVYYDGSNAEWQDVQIAAGNAVLTDAKIHYRPMTLTLPASTTTLESEAFADLPGTYRIVMTEKVERIDPTAFSGTDVILVAPAGSYAESWARDHDVTFIAE